MFLDMKVKDLMFPQLNDINNNTDVEFLVDVLKHLDNLNVIIWGKHLSIR
jgi:hypothetical protein